MLGRWWRQPSDAQRCCLRHLKDWNGLEREITLSLHDSSLSNEKSVHHTKWLYLGRLEWSPHLKTLYKQLIYPPSCLNYTMSLISYSWSVGLKHFLKPIGQSLYSETHGAARMSDISSMYLVHLVFPKTTVNSVVCRAVLSCSVVFHSLWPHGL